MPIANGSSSQSASNAAVSSATSDKNSRENSTVELAQPSFDFKRATPGMGDLIRRLYRLRLNCGLVARDVEESEKQLADRRRLMKKLDKFEFKKTVIMQDVEAVRKLLGEREQDPTNRSLANRIRKELKQLQQEYRELKQLQTCAKKGLGNVWSHVKLDPEILKQREEDVQNVGKHIDFVVSANRKFTLLQGDGPSLNWTKSSRPMELQSVEQLQEATEDIALPMIDISEGLRQIEEEKKKQGVLLEEIEKQVMQMQSVALDFRTELDMQFKMLSKMDKDVTSHEQSLRGLNTRVETLIRRVGGTFRLFCCGSAILFILLCIGMIYFAVTNFLKSGH